MLFEFGCDSFYNVQLTILELNKNALGVNERKKAKRRGDTIALKHHLPHSMHLDVYLIAG